jgi:hypothetical protein
MTSFGKLVSEAEELICGGGDIMLLHRWAYHANGECNCMEKMQIETLPDIDPERLKAYDIAYRKLVRT